jgi:basic membrane lipoprotein Med (substrate-binding protein (PBP1-ABC) superfamily)
MYYEKGQMMMAQWRVVIVSILLASVLDAAGGTLKALKVSSCYVGAIGDFGWGYHHHQGHTYLEAPVPETAERSGACSVGYNAAAVLWSMDWLVNGIIGTIAH